MKPRRFPPPWSIDEHKDACFIRTSRSLYERANGYNYDAVKDPAHARCAGADRRWCFGREPLARWASAAVSHGPKLCFAQFTGLSRINAGALHEQRAQITITTPADTPKDRSISRRHLLRH